ncbi:MAG: triose-phosphate isomerase [Pseudomonadota bacterium]
MARTPLIAGNWKMHKTVAMTVAFLGEILPKVEEAGCEILVTPPFTALAAAASILRGTRVALGAQDVHWERQGAYTGEISPSMLKEAGCDYCIVGHSERRQFFSETNETVRCKTQSLLAEGLTPIVCVGETLEEREQGRTFEVIDKQVRECFNGASVAGEGTRVVAAYEPVWAIGTGLTATGEQAQEVHARIRQLLKEHLGRAGEDVRILYGGSVTPQNIAGLMSEPDIDGALVGGASLKVESFVAIANYRRHG